MAAYYEILKNAEEFEVEGSRIKVLDIDTLIAAKTVAGREKDKIAVRHLQAIKQQKSKAGDEEGKR